MLKMQNQKNKNNINNPINQNTQNTGNNPHNQPHHNNHTNYHTSHSHNHNQKKRIPTDKELMDFLLLLEDKYEHSKLQNFVDIIKDSKNEDNSKTTDKKLTEYKIPEKLENSKPQPLQQGLISNLPSEEDILLQLRDFLSISPNLIYEFNKYLPKSFKLGIIDQSFAYNFLNKLKSKNSGLFKSTVKILNQYKNEIISQEEAVKNITELFSSHREGNSSNTNNTNNNNNSKYFYERLYEDLLAILDVKSYTTQIARNKQLHYAHSHHNTNNNHGIKLHGNSKLHHQNSNSNNISNNINNNNPNNTPHTTNTNNPNMNNSNTNNSNNNTGRNNNRINSNSTNNNPNNTNTNPTNNSNISKTNQSQEDFNTNNANSNNAYSHLNKGSMKNHVNPEYLFFDNLKNVLNHDRYINTIKLLHLFNIGVLNHTEFSELCENILIIQNSNTNIGNKRVNTINNNNNMELLSLIKQITLTKLINRKNSSIINKPLSEIDFSKSFKVGSSYSEYPDEFPIPVTTGRIKSDRNSDKLNLNAYNSSNGYNSVNNNLFNDRLVSVPNGSEDDKNPLKKNHYEEHIFKFEDQRYEIDMSIEGFKTGIEELECITNPVNITNTNFNISNKPEVILSEFTMSLIKKVYKEYQTQILESLENNRIETIEIIVERFKKRLEESLNSKIELEKQIRSSFDRFYYKSFDYRSFKFKNFEKKNTNAKAFVKEIVKRSIDKIRIDVNNADTSNNTNNINYTNNRNNILKGGVESSEFYWSFGNINDSNTIKSLNYNNSLNSNNALLNSSFSSNTLKPCYKYQLPDLRLNFSNVKKLKTAFYIIVYYLIYNTNNSILEDKKTIDYLYFIAENFFNLKLNRLYEKLLNNKNKNSENGNSGSNHKDNHNNSDKNDGFDYIGTIEELKKIGNINNPSNSNSINSSTASSVFDRIEEYLDLEIIYF